LRFPRSTPSSKSFVGVFNDIVPLVPTVVNDDDDDDDPCEFAEEVGCLVTGASLSLGSGGN
jgi:hypothetical protein